MLVMHRYKPDVLTKDESPEAAQYEYKQGGIVEIRPWMQQMVAYGAEALALVGIKRHVRCW